MLVQPPEFYSTDQVIFHSKLNASAFHHGQINSEVFKPLFSVAQELKSVLGRLKVEVSAYRSNYLTQTCAR